MVVVTSLDLNRHEQPFLRLVNACKLSIGEDMLTASQTEALLRAVRKRADPLLDRHGRGYARWNVFCVQNFFHLCMRLFRHF